MKFKYYYRVDGKGNPIPGSNIKSNKRLNSHYRELIPQSILCCTDTVVPTATGNSTRYYVRLNEDKNPISGTLRKHKTKPNWGQFQEVIPSYCCVPVDTLPIITVQPVDQEGGEGDSVTFSATVTGNNLVYQWQYLGEEWTNLTDNTYVEGANTSEVTLLLNDGYFVSSEIRLLVTNGAGTIISDSAILTINP